MPWIRDVPFEEAEGELRDIYDQVTGGDGQVDAVLRVHGLRAPSLWAHLQLYVSSLHRRPNELSRRERELVGTVVSVLNGCDYCVAHHRTGLARILGDDRIGARRLVEEALASLSREPSQSGSSEAVSLTDRERALVAYADKLTERPASMVADDLVPLREHGLTDAGILDLNQVVSYFAYVNRVVLGLGVEAGTEVLGLHPEENGDDLEHR